MDALTLVNHALNLTKDRLARVPSFHLYTSILAQLEYLAGVLDGREQDRSRLKDIIVGHYGAREFKETDPEFSRALMEAQLIASKMARGLKV